MHWGNNLASLSPLSKALRKTRGGTPRNNSQTESSRAPRSTPSKKTKKNNLSPEPLPPGCRSSSRQSRFLPHSRFAEHRSRCLGEEPRQAGHRSVVQRKREEREGEREEKEKRKSSFGRESVGEREKKTIFPTTFNEGFACSARSLLVFCTLLSEKHYFPPKSIRVRLHGRRPFRWRRRSRRRRQEARPQAPRRPWPHRRHRQRRRRHR